MFLFGSPFSALFDSCARRVIAMLRVTGVPVQQFAGKGIAFSAMDESLFLAARRHRALPMEGMAHCGDAAAAMAWRFIFAAFAAQATSGIDHMPTLSANARRTG